MTEPPAPPPPGNAPSIPDLARRLQEGARQLEQQFLGKEETIRLLFVSALAGEHLVMVGDMDSDRRFAEAIGARYLDVDEFFRE